LRRLVIDPSVLLAAPVGRPEGSPSLLIEAARSGVIEMIACETVVREFERGLENRYFSERVLPEERALLVAMVRGIASMADDPVDPPRVLRDPNDDYLVALARAANADAIVSGDRDLLDHEGLEPPAMSARDACERLGLLTS
jgi:putative PIN family toxin of toxin-antitoxin system